MTKEQLRYGENPHQKAWREKDESYNGPTVLNTPLHGKPMGNNNILDSNSALEVTIDMHRHFPNKPSAVVIKHGNPCGLATGENLEQAFVNAWLGDEISASGSIVGYSQEVTKDVVKLLSGKFVEIVVAQSYEEEALAWIKGRKSKKDLRVIATGPLDDAPDFVEERGVRGGKVSQTNDNKLYLCETIDNLLAEPQTLTEPNSGGEYQVGTMTNQKFNDGMQGLIEFSIIAGKHTKSNAIVILYEYADGQYRMLGMGAGQPNRKDSGEKLAIPKARENLMRQYFREEDLDYTMTMDRMIKDERFRNTLTEKIEKYIRDILSSDKVVAFSDAFFPKPDGLIAIADLGIKYIVSPGGSKEDANVIKAANKLDVALILTGMRHFRH